MAIVKRLDKGSALTYSELDGNFDHLTAADAVIQADVNAHEARTDNPHTVTKTQVGLGSVDNTADLDKPVSTATQTAIDNHVNDTSAAHADSSITFTPAGTGAVASTVQAKLREVASVKDFGAVGDNSTDDAAAFNLAINAINAGTITYLHIPKGTYVIGSALTAITADNWTIMGDGESSVLVMKTTVSPNTLSNFFTIGSTSVSADYWRISNLHFLNENTATMGATNAIVVEQCTVGYIDHIHADDVAGFLTLGTASDTVARRLSVSNCKVEMYGPAAGTCFDIILAYVFSVTSVLVTMPTDGATAKGIHIHPANDNVIDSHKWQGVEFNFPNTTIDKIFVMEATDGLIVNQWFDNCVFDHAGVACVSLLVGATATASSRYHNIVFSNCRITARQDTTGIPVVIDVDASREVKNVQFNGGTLIANDNSCVVITQIGQDVTSSFFGVGLLDGTTSTYPATTDRPAIVTDFGNIKVIGCYADVLSHVDDCHFNYGVQFTTTAQDFVVSNNNFNAVTVADVDVSALANTGQDNKIISNNVAPKRAIPAYKQTTEGTAAILMSQVLTDASTYNIRATVVGVKSDGTQRATYEIVGTFYRTGGGNVVQQGSTTVVHSAESDSAWDCAFSISTTTLRVMVTGAAATTINWVGRMDFTQITEA